MSFNFPCHSVSSVVTFYPLSNSVPFGALCVKKWTTLVSRWTGLVTLWTTLAAFWTRLATQKTLKSTFLSQKQRNAVLRKKKSVSISVNPCQKIVINPIFAIITRDDKS